MSKERKPGACARCGLEWQPENFLNPRKCAFEGETFSANNWKCGLVGEIRRAMTYGNPATAMQCRHEEYTHSALFVAVPDLDPETPTDTDFSGIVVARWYKRRGECDELRWGLEGDGVDGPELTREQAVKIVAQLMMLEAGA